MIKFRFHRGSLDESLKTECHFTGEEEFYQFIREHMQQYHDLNITRRDIYVRWYCYDDRIGWDTYIVIVGVWGVVGFCNKPLMSFS